MQKRRGRWKNTRGRWKNETIVFYLFIIIIKLEIYSCAKYLCELN